MESKNVIKSIIILALFFLNTSVWSQKKETVYLLFEKCKDNQKLISEEKDRIDFYIGRENFICTCKKESVDTLDISLLKSMKVLKIDELKLMETNIMKEKGKEIMKEYGIPFPTKTMYHNIFDIYLIEKIDCNKIVKHKVKWQYYVK
jgi:carbamoylphosphate synthase large subunit